MPSIAMQSLHATLTSPYTCYMASLTIRNLDEPVKARLRIQAAVHGRSMEEEARTILRAALSAEPGQPGNLAEAIQARFAPHGGVELEPMAREPIRDPPTFNGERQDAIAAADLTDDEAALIAAARIPPERRYSLDDNA